MSKKRFFFFSNSNSTKPSIKNINSSFKKKEEENEDGSSSNFRDGLNMFIDLEKFENGLPKFDPHNKLSEGSDQNSQKSPPVKKNQKEEELEGSILLVGSLSENPKKILEEEKSDELSNANVVLKINQTEEGVSNVVVKPTSSVRSKKSSKNFNRGR